MSEPQGISGDVSSDDATAQEILLVDRDPNILRGLETLFRAAGLTVTAVSDPEKARDQIANRFLAVALVDLDTPTPLAGLDLLKVAKEKSPLTSVVVMSQSASFDVIAPAFRAGAADVVLKSQSQVPYIRDRVSVLVRQTRQSVGRERLLGEVSEIHEEFLHKMMELQRQVTDLEDRVLNRDADYSTTTVNPGVVNVLLADDEPGLHVALEAALPAEHGWRIRLAQSGGEALDFASQAPPQIAIIKEQLPDLMGSMVVKSIKATAPDAMAIVFSPPRGKLLGDVRVVEATRTHTLVPSFSEPRQLIAALDEVREAIRRKSRERRYLKVFRQQHLEFLKRYNYIKQKLPKPGSSP